MRVEFVNPFIMSFVNVVRKVASLNSNRGELTLKKTPYPSQEISIIIGVTGRVRGQVLYSMDRETAMGIASNMLMGLKIVDLDEMAKSAVCELANIITGNASIDLSDNGYSCDITPPALIIGKDYNVAVMDIKTLSLPITTDVGTVEINVALKEQTQIS